MVNYENSIIYKLCCKDPEVEEIYVGSTTNFRRRKCLHKSRCMNESVYDTPVYQFIRANGNWVNWDMVEVKRVKCRDKQHLHRKERKYIEKLKATLNVIIPTRSKKEWMPEYCKQYYQQNKESIKKQKNEYYHKNKTTISAKRNVLVECECGCKVSKSNIAAHKKTQKHKRLME